MIVSEGLSPLANHGLVFEFRHVNAQGVFYGYLTFFPNVMGERSLVQMPKITVVVVVDLFQDGRKMHAKFGPTDPVEKKDGCGPSQEQESRFGGMGFAQLQVLGV